MQCSVPFVKQSLCLQRWDSGLQRWVYNGCTVRFVYRIFEYSFVLGIFDSLGFRIFVLALIKNTLWLAVTIIQRYNAAVYELTYRFTSGGR